MKKIRRIFALIISAALALSTFAFSASASYDGAINQGKSHSEESSMYKYDIDIYLYNPCNSNDMDKDAVYLLWFDFNYKTDNGYGTSSTYRLDMSWKSALGRNLNNDILKANFIRANDNACMTRFSVWLPGILSDVKVFLNMDGGERLAFTVESISLNGFKLNTDTDYVSSAYWDSNASVKCFVPRAALVGATDTDAAPRDQFDGIFTDANVGKALDAFEKGDMRMIYHSFINKTK